MVRALILPTFASLVLFYNPSTTVAQEAKEPTLAGQSLQVWVKRLAEGDAADKRQAVAALRGVGPWAKAAVPVLARATTDDDPTVRRYAAYALGNIGPEAKEAVPALVKALGDEELAVRYSAAQALGKVGPAAESAIPALNEALSDRNELVQLRAAESLAQISEKEAARAADFISDTLFDDIEADNVRLEAAVTLARVAPERAAGGMPRLRRAFQNEGTFLQVRAAEALVRIDKKTAADVTPTLVRIVQNPDETPRVRAEAAVVLARIDPDKVKSAKEILVRFYRGGDTVVALTAAEALKLIDPALAEQVGIP